MLTAHVLTGGWLLLFQRVYFQWYVDLCLSKNPLLWMTQEVPAQSDTQVDAGIIKAEGRSYSQGKQKASDASYERYTSPGGKKLKPIQH